MLWCWRLIGVGVGRFYGINGNYWRREQLASARDVVGAFAAGEQAIIADAMEACGQRVHRALPPLPTISPLGINMCRIPHAGPPGYRVAI